MLAAADLPARIWPLPARKINGIGPKAGAKLEALGIRTIGELAAADPARLIEHFGKSYGAWLHEAAHGRDERPVVTFSEPRRSAAKPLSSAICIRVRDRDALCAIFTELCVRVAEDLAAQGLRRPHDRHQAALRRLPDRHARPHHRAADARMRDDTARGGRVPQAREPRAPACGCSACGSVRSRAAPMRRRLAPRKPTRHLWRAPGRSPDALHRAVQRRAPGAAGDRRCSGPVRSGPSILTEASGEKPRRGARQPCRAHQRGREGRRGQTSAARARLLLCCGEVFGCQRASLGEVNLPARAAGEHPVDQGRSRSLRARLASARSTRPTRLHSVTGKPAAL